MDTDWCLTCDRHLESSSPAPYCSHDCRCDAGPSHLANHPYSYYGEEDYYEEPLDEPQAHQEDEDALLYHEITDASHYTGNDYSGIVAWAAAVVPGSPPFPQHALSRSRASSASISTASSSASTCSRSSSQSRRSRRSSTSVSSPKTLTSTCKPPVLLSARRPLAPALSFTPTPRNPKPSLPLDTTALPPPKAYSSRTTSATCSTSTAQDSSALATPVSASGPMGIVGQVLSWVAPSPLTKSAAHSPVESKMLQIQQKHTHATLPVPALYRGRKSGRVPA